MSAFYESTDVSACLSSGIFFFFEIVFRSETKEIFLRDHWNNESDEETYSLQKITSIKQQP